MRFKSGSANGFQVFAVAGVNTVSFAITASRDARKDLLGFAVVRTDPHERERYVMPGFKVFRSLIPRPDEKTTVSTWDHPVQSFVWDDFTAKPDRRYTYEFHPLRGTPRNLDRSAAPLEIAVRTEPLFSDQEHDVFFNRGVASSQAYARKFGNARPDDLPEGKQRAALQWLTRELDDAILKFIGQAGANDTLLCCFYEFRYRPVADALKAAIDRGADVRIVVDAKVNETTDKDGAFHESFPREENLRMIAAAKLPRSRIVRREARRSSIAHNKFMVLLRGQGDEARPAEVWTGSTNISVGGIAGQTNVGHWVRHEAAARSFRDYWNLLAGDPGGEDGDDASTVRAKNAAFRKEVEALSATPADLAAIPPGVTAVFSPRSKLDVLELYFRLVDGADHAACITLAFGVNDAFKKLLADNTPQQPIVFMLLEKEDRPKKGAKGPFLAINATNNVYKAWGAFLEDPVYQWARETNAGRLGINAHVSYVHSKFLLRDPLGSDPLVVTGSANFSDASTKENDENMILVRGDKRVADIYFTEFNRLFNHYYFRSVHEALKRNGEDAESELFLKEKPSEWLAKYAPGTLRTKRVKMFAEMDDGVTTP
jgi:phosphatidylserine/phosphatidylglycerophosphate/cardiolipin synthase-like enzyme